MPRLDEVRGRGTLGADDRGGIEGGISPIMYVRSINDVRGQIAPKNANLMKF